MTTRPAAWIGPRGIAMLAGLAVAGGCAALVVAWPVVVVGVAVIALAALAADAALVARAPHIRRTVPERLMLARRDVFTYAVTNRAAVPLHFAILEAPADKLAVDVAPARGRVLPGASAIVRVSFMPRERGRSQIGVAFAWFESPLGLVRGRLRFGAFEPVHIRPDLSALERGGTLSLRARSFEAGLRRIRKRGIGSDFESLREYAAGDPFRSIDWKATARRGKMMVAQYDIERSQQIVMALDAGRLMSPRLDDRRKLDYAVSAALSVASIAQAATDRVGLHAFAGATLAAVAPRAGAQQTAILTDVLSDLEPHFEESDYERAALEIRRRFRKRSLIVVFTDLFDPVASSAVLGSLALLAPHHLVLVVLMNDAAIVDTIERAPERARDVYRASVATNLAADRARAVALLRNRGIGVVDVPARDLTLAVIDAYIEVKTRALL